MIKQTPGKIFLADQRGLTETAQFRRYSTFNFGRYEHEHKVAFGSLDAVNEEILAGAQSIALPVEQASYVLIIPITGAVIASSLQGEPTTVEVEEIQIRTVPAYSVLYLTNPYETELISFLHIWIKAGPQVKDAVNQIVPFSAQAINNQLAAVIAAGMQRPTEPPLPFAVSLGRFAGRREATYLLQSSRSRFFAFVVAGAFEAEGRLLHEHDGLALWEVEEVELEALSNDALVLVLELID
ncbi:hypothetical protein [Hymenobacter sp. BT491]|uniref:pirin family protein n=1 Tax=Hymenobacter sp. BT491 TaxID=2766779 RepID=UPI0016538CCB|nr:hypothetical protein [Hymenobacter sp. BT491]MBC6992520.1 hypothetical protein [Hymenobacter sp. BT491]